MLEQRVLDFFSDTCPVEPGNGLLVAVSGGPDSVALLHVLLEVQDTAGFRIDVAHLNHGLRGREGDADEAFVASLCQQHHLPFHHRRVDLPSMLEREGGSVEATARRERYAFFEEARGVAGARWIVTGHSADDQVETFLLNLIRGAGPRGLGGMLAVGPGSVCRPLLACWRDEILAFLEQNGIRYRVDGSNEDLALTRNRVRHRLVPLLTEHFGESVVRVLARESRLMNELDQFLDQEADRILGSVANREARESTGEYRLSIPALGAHPRVLQRTVIRAALQSLLGGLREVTLAHLDAVLELTEGDAVSGSLDLPRGILVQREYDDLVLAPGVSKRRPEPPEASPPLTLESPGTERWGGMRLSWSTRPADSVTPEEWSNQPDRACFDWDNVTPLVLASREGRGPTGTLRHGGDPEDQRSAGRSKGAPAPADSHRTLVRQWRARIR